MNAVVNVILAIQILTALGMIGLILIQHGKGADMGAAFGSVLPGIGTPRGGHFRSIIIAHFMSNYTATLESRGRYAARIDGI